MPDTCPTTGREWSLSDSAPGAWPPDRACEPLPRGWIANLIKREFLLWNVVMIKRVIDNEHMLTGLYLLVLFIVLAIMMEVLPA